MLPKKIALAIPWQCASARRDGPSRLAFNGMRERGGSLRASVRTRHRGGPELQVKKRDGNHDGGKLRTVSPLAQIPSSASRAKSGIMCPRVELRFQRAEGECSTFRQTVRTSLGS